MDNVPIEGGTVYGPPADWVEERDGTCLSISVLHSVLEGSAWGATAWKFSEEELDALEQADGLFVLSIRGAGCPVMKLQVQTAEGSEVGQLGSVIGRERATQDALRAIASELYLRTAASLEAVPLDSLGTVGLLERIMERVQTLPPANMLQVGRVPGADGPGPDMRTIPLRTLDQVVEDARRRRSGEDAPPDVTAGIMAELDRAGFDPKHSDLGKRIDAAVNARPVGKQMAEHAEDFMRSTMNAMLGRSITVYLDAETIAGLEAEAADRERTVDDLAAAAISEAVLNARHGR
jgi:hypothetical protein